MGFLHARWRVQKSWGARRRSEKIGGKCVGAPPMIFAHRWPSVAPTSRKSWDRRRVPLRTCSDQQPIPHTTPVGAFAGVTAAAVSGHPHGGIQVLCSWLRAHAYLSIRAYIWSPSEQSRVKTPTIEPLPCPSAPLPFSYLMCSDVH